ncbi:hypothetical protein CTAYLR_010709 [Chrysophaeum taylorii]|uniref:non-specific serine/threonine protein kinase n=1 Tax=Chrysophaeum taylorii TaxID=2483200 RepID=A0AAD7UB89_9STRA|nr:hypothetical protein CTAYLR_010709 [Chrysophaeum taylorii]
MRRRGCLAVVCRCLSRYRAPEAPEEEEPETPKEEDVRNPVLEIVSVDNKEAFEEDEEEPEEDYVMGGYHPVSVNDVYDDRYRVVEKLGWGVYSTVWRCLDAKSGTEIALKIQKSAPEYTNAALNEIDVLRTIQQQARSQNRESDVVVLVEHFYVSGPHGNHVCMVFELLGRTLLHAIQETGSLPLQEVRDITRCLLRCLAFVHDSVGVLHTDIKPENVLLCGPGRVKLVDLGTAFFLDKQTARDIQTREYRCPEGILGIWPFTPTADVWSVGCLVFELLTGETLFDPQSPRPGDAFTKDESHLAQAVELLGPIPPALLDKRARGHHWFTPQAQLRNISVAPPPPGCDAIARVLQDNFAFSPNDASDVSTFLARLLDYLPEKRASANLALSLPWLQDPPSF